MERLEARVHELPPERDSGGAVAQDGDHQSERAKTATLVASSLSVG